ncbi:hypothetical protein [Sulfurisphaera ohwakuensis]|nr:hypothetical protein [Sulfurisphaera ohwakuensis]MBB5254996.1 hypothetical protein [Sulfurisphaera ohwakuensis]
MKRVSQVKISDVISFILLYAISLAPIYIFLFSNGYYNYYNYNIPFFSGTEMSWLFYPSVYVPEVGLQVNIGIYYLFLLFFTNIIHIYNVITIAKFFLFITFSIIYFSIYIIITKFMNILHITRYRNIIRGVSILFFFLNPEYLEILGYDFYNFIFGIIAFSYVIIKIIDISVNNYNPKKMDYIKAGLSLGFAGMMDPRIFVLGLYIISSMVIILVITNRRSAIKSFKYGVLGLFSSLPIVAYIYYLFAYPSIITTHSISKAISVPSYRPDTYSYIATWSGNSHLFNVFTFANFGWSSIVFSPPSILFYPRSEWWYLPYFGSPALILLPHGIITYIWLGSLYIFIIIALIGLFDKSKKLPALLLFVPLFIILSISAGTNVPIKQFVYMFEIDPSHIPIIGGIFGTTFAIPFVAAEIAPILASLLTVIGINYILTRLHKPSYRSIAITVVVVLAVFASWQYFNGTLYPSQVTGSFPGNSISLQGYYAPLYPPPQWVHVMNILSTSNAGVAYAGEIGFSEKWAHYQFISHTPFLMPGYATISPPPVKYVNQTPVAYDISGTKYLFIDNTSYTPLSNSFIYSYLNYSGLKVIYAKGDVYLLEQPNASVFRYAEEALSINTTNENIAFEVEDLLYPLLNYTPAIISPQGGIKVLVNPTQVTSSYMAFFNESTNVSISPGKYIILNGTTTEKYLSGIIHVNPNTLIIPSNINLSKLISYPLNFSFNQLTASFTVNVKPGYIIETSLPLPNGGVIANGGKILGQNVFGQTVFSSNSNTVTLSIKLGFFTNVLMTAVDIFFYLMFAYFIIYKGLKSSGITRVLLSAIRNSGFKSSK